eukprot:812337-Amphidinium_carterae.1
MNLDLVHSNMPNAKTPAFLCPTSARLQPCSNTVLPKPTPPAAVKRNSQGAAQDKMNLTV